MAMKVAKEYKTLTGTEKAAVLFLCLGEARGGILMSQLDELDIHRITHAMSALGSINSEIVENVIKEFIEGITGAGGIYGSYEMAEKLLQGFLPEGKVGDIMRDIRGPMSGRNVWDSFSSLNEGTIANYLRSEHDQTVAAILTKVRPEVAAKVLPLLGPERMTEVVERMLVIESLPRDVLEQLEETLAQEFLVSATTRTGPDSTQRMAELFNKMDSTIFDELSIHLEESQPDTFSAIKQKMFTFDDLARLDLPSLARVMRTAEGTQLPMALRGAKKEVRERFLDALPARSRDMLVQEMANMGPVRARDVQVAQSLLIDQALDMARKDEITLPTENDDMLVD